MEDVWLGAPQYPQYDEVNDIETSKIGGDIIPFRATSKCITEHFECPKCHSFDYVSLLAQLFVPKRCNDRVIYILTCGKCSSNSIGSQKESGSKSLDALTEVSKTSFCFALRSQNFNRSFFELKKKEFETTLSQKVKVHESLFAEDTEWGDDGNEADQMEKLNEDASKKSECPEIFSEIEEEEFLLFSAGTSLKSKFGKQYTKGIALDTFKEKLRTVNEVNEEITRKFGDISSLLEQSEGEIDETSKIDKWVENYMERIGNNPSQCVRWSPGGYPLRVSTEEIFPPPCQYCGAARHFEVQLTAPVVYFLTKDIGESNNNYLHFSNVLVFTCSANCNNKDTPYFMEYVVSEDEL